MCYNQCGDGTKCYSPLGGTAECVYVLDAPSTTCLQTCSDYTYALRLYQNRIIADADWAVTMSRMAKTTL